MLCAVCKNELPENAKFCMSCGTKVVLENKCSSCGEVLVPGAKFCLNCGQKVNNIDKVEIESNIELYDLYGSTIRIPIDDVKLHKLISNMSDHAYDIILKKYVAAGGLQSAAADFPKIVKKAYKSCANKVLNVITKTTKRYDITENDILNLTNSYANINQLKEYLKEQYEELQNEKDIAKMHRERRKDSRSRVVGGGFSLSGAAKGMAIAGAVNMMTGAAHSMYNAVDGMLTNGKISDEMEDVYLAVKENLYEAIELDMTNIVLAISETMLGKNVSGYSLTEENSNKAAAIFKAIKSGRVPKNEIREQIVKALEYNVCCKDSYIKAYNIVGDNDDSLKKLADKVFLHSAVVAIKEAEMVACKKEFASRFKRVDKENRAALLEFKESLQEANMYFDSDNLSNAVDEAISDVEKKFIESNTKAYNCEKAPEIGKILIEQNYPRQHIVMYYEWYLSKKFQFDINHEDFDAVRAFKSELEKCDYISPNAKVKFAVKATLNGSGLENEWINVDKGSLDDIFAFKKKVEGMYLESSVKKKYTDAAAAVAKPLLVRARLQARLDEIDISSSSEINDFYAMNKNNSYPEDVFNEYCKKLEEKVQNGVAHSTLSDDSAVEDEEVTSSDYPISISIFGNMFNKYIEEVRKDGGKSFYSFANLDAKKIGNFCMYANEKFNRSPKHDEVVAYYDSTMFGKGDEGVAVALDGVYYLNDTDHIYEYVSYDEMNQPAVYDSGMFSNNIIVNTNSGEVKMALYADGASGVRREIVNVINYIRSKVKSKVIDVSKVADESEIPPTGNTDGLCTYKITLRDCGTLSKIDAIKAIRTVLDLDISLSDAKSLVDKVPSVLVPNCSFDEMTKLRQELNDAGLTVDISKN